MVMLANGVGTGRQLLITMLEEAVILWDRLLVTDACYAAGRGILILGTGSVRLIGVPVIHRPETQNMVYV